MPRSRLLRLALPVLLALPVTGLAASPAAASSHTTCRITVTDLGPTLKIVYSVHAPTLHRRYGIRITVDGNVIFRKRMRTTDGRLRIRVDVQDEPGNELVRGRARDLSNEAVCLATVLAPAG